MDSQLNGVCCRYRRHFVVVVFMSSKKHICENKHINAGFCFSLAVVVVAIIILNQFFIFNRSQQISYRWPLLVVPALMFVIYRFGSNNCSNSRSNGVSEPKPPPNECSTID